MIDVIILIYLVGFILSTVFTYGFARQIYRHNSVLYVSGIAVIAAMAWPAILIFRGLHWGKLG